MTIPREAASMSLASPTSITGIGVCPGRAAGPVALMAPRPRLPADHPEVADIDAEVRSAIDALSRTADELEARAASSSMPAAAEVLEATAMIACDPSLEEAIRSAIAKGDPAAWAVDRAIDAFRAMLLDLGGCGGARDDLDDVRDQRSPDCSACRCRDPQRDTPYILVADDLAPPTR
jgi:phosphotransferase system enzyme I (PtsI)